MSGPIGQGQRPVNTHPSVGSDDDTRPFGQRVRARWRRLLSSPSTWPLRVRLVAAVLLLTGIGLTVASGAAVAALRTYLYDKVDSGLQATTRQMVTATERGVWGRPTAGPQLPSQYVLTVYAASGTELDQHSSGLYRQQPAIPSIGVAQAHRMAGEPFNVRSQNGPGRWRVLVTPMPDDSGSVAVAVNLATTDQTVAQLAVIVTVVGAGVLALVGGLGYVVVRTSLRPLVEVETTAATIAGGDLSRRVPRLDPRTEIGRLSAALNTMLTQIEQAFRDRQASEAAARRSESRMRQFVADASHELRTPLTSIRGFSELYRQGATGTQDDVDRLMRRIEDESTRMGVLVDDLLLLARLDQRRPMERAAVDLLELAQDAVGDASAVAPDRDISLEAEYATGPVITGDEARLRQVLSNLVNNALTHTPADAPVIVRVGGDHEDPRYARVEVSDRGPGLSAEDAPRVFERFYRVDTSRSRAAGGTGLGLSIVAAIVDGHGGRVAVDSAPGDGATFRVLLPR